MTKQMKNYEDLNTGNHVNMIHQKQYPVSFPEHWHKNIEIIYIPSHSKISKPVLVKTINDNYSLSSGDILLLWPDEVHSVSQNYDQQVQALQFSQNILNGMPDLLYYLPLLHQVHLIEYDPHNTEYSDVLLELLEQIFFVQNEKKRLFEMKKNLVLIDFFLHLISYFSDTNPMIVSQKIDYEPIQKACLYISTHYENEITLNDISSMFGFSPCYFSKLFRQVTTYRFTDYLTHCRINAAVNMLTDSTNQISAIAFKCGFSSISNFNRAFHQVTGYSPSHFRKLQNKQHGA